MFIIKFGMHGQTRYIPLFVLHYFIIFSQKKAKKKNPEKSGKT